jgi:transcription initiation factor TFIIIB Brf1 subunit/transcription initiation factor TFIIB
MSEEGEKCVHNVRVEDVHTGEEICIQCGLVLSTVYYYTNEHVVQSECAHKLNKIVESEKNVTITDLCHAVHLNEVSYIEKATTVAKKLELDLILNKVRFQKKTIEAYAVYNVLRDNGHSATIEDISRLSGIKQNKIWQLEKLFQNCDVNMNAPEKHVEKLCYQLQLDRQTAHRIIGNPDFEKHKKTLEGTRPVNIAAIIVYICLKNQYNSKLTLTEFSRRVMLPRNSLHRCLKKIDI